MGNCFLYIFTDNDKPSVCFRTQQLQAQSYANREQMKPSNQYCLQYKQNNRHVSFIFFYLVLTFICI